jgi:hypothetical protein
MTPTFASSLKVDFVDFFHTFSRTDNHMLKLLQPHFPLELSDNPDYLFYSVWGGKHSHEKYNRCIKIFCTEENVRPNFCKCDYSLTFDYSDNPRNLRLPLYVRYLFQSQERNGASLVKPPRFDPEKILASKTKFCNFVYSNPVAERLRFFEMLSRYKRIDSGGSVANNIGRRVDDKLEFIAPYKFTIAFENSSYPGYVTEKLVEPMLVNSMPIYWGNPLIAHDFNAGSFINCHEYPDWQAVIKKIVELDQEPSQYLKYAKEPWFRDNVPNSYCQPDYLVPFFSQVFNDKTQGCRRLDPNIRKLDQRTNRYHFSEGDDA